MISRRNESKQRLIYKSQNSQLIATVDMINKIKVGKKELRICQSPWNNTESLGRLVGQRWHLPTKIPTMIISKIRTLVTENNLWQKRFYSEPNVFIWQQ